MKTLKHLSISFSLLLMLIAFTACEEREILEGDVPSEVLATFNERYPDATQVQWEHYRGQRKYEATYMRQGSWWWSEFRPNGNHIETARMNDDGDGYDNSDRDDHGDQHSGAPVAKEDLPQAIREDFSTRFVNATDVRWERYTLPSEKFEATFRLDGSWWNADYRTDGTFIEQSRVE